VVLVAPPSGAQTKAGAKPSGNRAAAEALFNQGRELMGAGKFSEACPKFEASQQLDPGLGTMLNLAECYEKTGRTASAWAEYREAIPLARATGSKARIDLANERAQALQERLSTLTIRAMSGGDDSAELEVRRDGVPVQPGELGSPIPVDPGEHTVEATAPGKQAWSSKVQVGADAAKVSVDVPVLQSASKAATPLSAGPSSTPEPSKPTESLSSGSAQRTTGIIAGAAGLVGVGIGSVFGLQASSNWSDAKKGCAAYPNACTAAALDQRSNASSQATISTIAFIAGGALLATGIILYFTAPKKSETVALGLGPGSAFVRGSFQ
jgi:hypothetical protein